MDRQIDIQIYVYRQIDEYIDRDIHIYVDREKDIYIYRQIVSSSKAKREERAEYKKQWPQPGGRGTGNNTN